MRRASCCRFGLAALAAAALATARPAHAQNAPGGRCVLEFQRTPTTRFSSVRQPSGEYNTFLGGGLVAYCVGQQINLRSDSAEYYGDTRILYLIGNVHYTEPRTALDSRRLTYWMVDERILAEGDVVAQMPSGTTMRGPVAEYWRAVRGMRPESRMIATQRPRVTLVERDSGGRESVPTELDADRFVTVADSLVYASGRVEIRRPDLLARGDSAFLDGGTEFARLMGRPHIQGRGERPFTLEGAVIDLYSTNRQLQRVLSSDAARATSEDVTMQSDTIDLRLADGRISRAYVWGSSRARVFSPTYELVADSLAIDMPGQRLREVYAVRGARAESETDTSRLRSVQRDWLEGDTIVATFDSVATGDSSSRPPIRELLATGGARSYYQIASNEGRDAPASVNYVGGRSITVKFEQRQVRAVTVRGQAFGVYLQPGAVAASPAAPAPSVPVTTPPGGRP